MILEAISTKTGNASLSKPDFDKDCLIKRPYKIISGYT